MRAVNFDKDKHYPIVTEWWLSHKFYPIHPKALSTNGIIIYQDDQPICAGWMYTTDSTSKFLEWIISNPKSDYQLRDKALDMLMDELLKFTDPGDTVWTFSQHKRLTERYQKHGFLIGDQDMTSLLRRM